MKKTLLTTALCVLFALSARAQEGAWSGDLNVMGTKLPLVFHFSAEGCTMDSPQQGARGIKAQWTPQADGTVKVQVPKLGVSYEGKYDGQEIRGTFKQNGLSLPLNLTSGEQKLNRPQTPVAPFPYTTEEVTFKDGEVELHGTLTLPEGCNAQTPALVMVTGSGLQNRDEELFGHKPFAVIADALARQGIATLRYDDRGFGENTLPSSALTNYHFCCDALRAIELLRERFTRVGVLGHSQGGSIALEIASRGKADFIVSMAGMAVSGRETMLAQNRHSLLAAGFDEEAVEKYCTALLAGFEQICEGKKAQEIPQPDVPYLLKVNFTEALKQCEDPGVRSIFEIDLADALPKIKCPVLALNGTKDIQVDCASNLDALRKGLKKNKHAKILSVEGLNHLFQHCQTGEVAEYGQIEETISPEVLTEMTTWVKQLK